jgi:hypothetical protein
MEYKHPIYEQRLISKSQLSYSITKFIKLTKTVQKYQKNYKKYLKIE